MPLGSSSEAPVISPGPSRPSSPLCAVPRGGAAPGDAGRQHGNRVSVGVCVRQFVIRRRRLRVLELSMLTLLS